MNEKPRMIWFVRVAILYQIQFVCFVCWMHDRAETVIASCVLVVIALLYEYMNLIARRIEYLKGRIDMNKEIMEAKFPEGY